MNSSQTSAVLDAAELSAEESNPKPKNLKKKSGPISMRRTRFQPAPSPCRGAACGGN